MACSLNNGFSVSGSSETILSCNRKGSLGLSPPIGTMQFPDSRSKEFMGKSLDVLNQRGFNNWSVNAPRHTPVQVQASLCVSRVLRWWEKIPTPNMIEIQSAQELVDTLLNARDKLIIIDFYSPGCGGCKALHPKICQFAETNPNAIFLKVNMEELRTMCECLRIHVMPFFRFYRGSEGKVCSFSCTNVTIKKFKDALAKYGTDSDRYGLGPAKGLDEKELLALASAGLISRTLPHEDTEKKKPSDEDDLLALAFAGQISSTLPLEPSVKEKTEELVLSGLGVSSPLSKDENIAGVEDSSAFVTA